MKTMTNHTLRVQQAARLERDQAVHLSVAVVQLIHHSELVGVIVTKRQKCHHYRCKYNPNSYSNLQSASRLWTLVDSYPKLTHSFHTGHHRIAVYGRLPVCASCKLKVIP
jgi:hypothetical protein